MSRLAFLKHAAELVGLGDACLKQRRVDRALAHWRIAERCGADPADLIAGRWTAHMLLGQFENAWRQSDCAARRREQRGRDPCDYTFWDGQPFENRDMLVRCCHGLGDTIQFARYLPLLRSRCRSVVFQVQRELMPLFAGVPSIDRMIPAWESMPQDVQELPQIEIMEFPYAFRTTLATVPNRVPYLSAVPALLPDPPAGTRLKVGLIWASSAWDSTRSIPLEMFSPLAQIPGIALYSLQWGPQRDALRLHPRWPMTDLMGICGDASTLAPTASFIQSLDLLIAPDTMAVHLAGALAKPAWVLLLHAADWRWMLDREDSPWYPTIRVFRQRAPGDWNSPISKVARELQAQLMSSRPS